MSLTPIYDITPQKRGTWFKGRRFQLFNELTPDVYTPRDITGYIFQMDFKRSETSNPVWSIKNDEGITIINAETGIFDIDPFMLNYPANNYLHELKITPPDGMVWVHFQGEFRIIQNITN
jgi:hypothetical protein